MKKAFTLVELLIVIIIIGVLAAIAVPQFKKMIARSEAAEAWTGMGQLRAAEQIYYAQYGVYCDTFLLNGNVPSTVATNQYLQAGVQEGRFVNYHTHAEATDTLYGPFFKIHCERKGHDRDAAGGKTGPDYWYELGMNADGSQDTSAYVPFQ